MVKCAHSISILGDQQPYKKHKPVGKYESAFRHLIRLDDGAQIHKSIIESIATGDFHRRLLVIIEWKWFNIIPSRIIAETLNLKYLQIYDRKRTFNETGSRNIDKHENESNKLPNILLSPLTMLGRRWMGMHEKTHPDRSRTGARFPS